MVSVIARPRELADVKFVVATDGSAHSEAAIEHGVALAEATDGSMTVLHVVDRSVQAEGGADPIVDLPDAAERLVVEDPDDAVERGEEILENAAAMVEEAGIPVDTELLEGDAVETIAEFAEQEGADGVVVGHRGLSERYEEHLGSVSKSLVERSTVPVTVVSGDGSR